MKCVSFAVLWDATGTVFWPRCFHNCECSLESLSTAEIEFLKQALMSAIIFRYKPCELQAQIWRHATVSLWLWEQFSNGQFSRTAIQLSQHEALYWFFKRPISNLFYFLIRRRDTPARRVDWPPWGMQGALTPCEKGRLTSLREARRPNPLREEQFDVGQSCIAVLEKLAVWELLSKLCLQIWAWSSQGLYRKNVYTQ